MKFRTVALALALSCGLATIGEARKRPAVTRVKARKVSKNNRVKPRKVKKAKAVKRRRK